MSRNSKRKVEQNEVIKLSKDIVNKMNDFELAVNELKMLSDSLAEIDRVVAEKEETNKHALKRLEDSFQDNKIKAVNAAARELGKLLVNSEELDELNWQVTKLTNEKNNIRAELEAHYKQLNAEKFEQEKKVLELNHQCNIAELSAKTETQSREIANLKDTIARMSKELESQKKLTSEVALAGRPAPVSN